MSDKKNRVKRKATPSDDALKIKKLKTETDVNGDKADVGNVMEFYAEKRKSALPDEGKEFKFNKKRVRMISKNEELPASCKGIVYWMFRDQRVEGNCYTCGFISTYSSVLT